MSLSKKIRSQVAMLREIVKSKHRIKKIMSEIGDEYKSGETGLCLAANLAIISTNNDYYLRGEIANSIKKIFEKISHDNENEYKCCAFCLGYPLRFSFENQERLNEGMFLRLWTLKLAEQLILEAWDKYTFNELSEGAKKRAIKDYIDGWEETHDIKDIDPLDVKDLLSKNEETLYNKKGEVLDELY